MDKWDEFTGRVQQALLAQEPEAAAAAGFALVCEFGRTLDRIATVLEAVGGAILAPEEVPPTDEGIPHELHQDIPETLEHDL